MLGDLRVLPRPAAVTAGAFVASAVSTAAAVLVAAAAFTVATPAAVRGQGTCILSGASGNSEAKARQVQGRALGEQLPVDLREVSPVAAAVPAPTFAPAALRPIPVTQPAAVDAQPPAAFTFAVVTVPFAIATVALSTAVAAALLKVQEGVRRGVREGLL